MNNELKQFTELTRRIRELSSPRIESMSDAEDYRLNLIQSFNRISELAKINQGILDYHFFPLMESEDELSDEMRELLWDFSASIIDPTSMENLDLPILFVQSERLVKDAEAIGDHRSVIIALDTMVVAAYALLTASLRLYPTYDICFKYRDVGISCAKKIIAYLEPEFFSKLDDECKELVLINSRYISSLFEWEDSANIIEQSREDLAVLERSLFLADDTFYREQAPGYDWDYHRIRTLQYITCLTEYRDAISFDKEIAEKILSYTEQFIELFHSNGSEISEECSDATVDIYLFRNKYLAGHLTKDEYKGKLREIYRMYNMHGEPFDDLYALFTTPYEYILLLDRNSLQEEDKALLRDFYSKLPSLVYHMSKVSVLSFLMTFLAHILNDYIEVDGVPDIGEMCLKIMAALHPPTYVHSYTVAALTTCLSRHLLERCPDYFVGILGAKDIAEVDARSEELLDFIHQSALLHDIGKLYIIETIITYWRRLLDAEFDTIQMHPKVGANLLASHESTREFADMACGHHKWFNDKAGYPSDFILSDSPYKVIVSILSVADCLDAATDTVGRNYKNCKTLDEYIAEISADSGTRYAPYAVDLLKDPEVHAEIDSILSNSRDDNYRKTYELLKEL